MLAVPIAVTTLSDLTTLGQSAATSNAADGFLALLNTENGNNNDIWSANGELANNGGSSNGQASTNNSVAPPVSVPTSIFAANSSGQKNTQNTNAPAPPPQQPSQEGVSSSANNQTQNKPTSLSSVPKGSTPSSNADSQNATSSASSQSSAPVTTAQAINGNVPQAAKQLRTQIQDQIGNISQILLSMIQALSAGTAQPVQATITNPTTATATATTSLSPLDVAGNNATGSTANGQAVPPSQTDQEIALLQDMQSLLQQLQQSLPGQGQNSQNNVQTLSDSLLSDMTKLSQLVSQPPSSNDSNTANSLASTTQFGDLSNLLKNSIAQAQNQLQALQTTNETIFAQAIANLQTPSVGITDQSKTTQDNNSSFTNAAPATSNTPAVSPVTQDVTIKPVIDNLSFNPSPLVQASVSQNGGNSAGSNNQDSSQNQTAQPVIAAASSSSSLPNATSGASFARILNQVSQGDVLDQVQFQVKTALSDGSSKITIQLNPPELGKVDVKLDVSADGKMNGVTIIADNKNTLDLLQRDTQGLTRALNDAGLTTDSGSLNFSLGGGQQNQTQGSQQAATTYQQAQPEEEDPTINAISKSYVVNLAEGLDIII